MLYTNAYKPWWAYVHLRKEFYEGSLREQLISKGT